MTTSSTFDSPKKLAPDALHQRRSGQDLIRADEQRQQVELARGQLDLTAVPMDGARADVEHEIGEAKLFVARFGSRLGPAQEGADASEQLIEIEGLDEIVVGPGVEPGDAVRDGVARGQHQDRQAPAGALLGRAKASGDLDTVEARQHEIEDEQVGRRVANGIEGAAPIVEDFDVVPLENQAPAHKAGNGGLVFDQQIRTLMPPAGGPMTDRGSAGLLTGATIPSRRRRGVGPLRAGASRIRGAGMPLAYYSWYQCLLHVRMIIGGLLL